MKRHLVVGFGFLRFVVVNGPATRTKRSIIFHESNVLQQALGPHPVRNPDYDRHSYENQQKNMDLSHHLPGMVSVTLSLDESTWVVSWNDDILFFVYQKMFDFFVCKIFSEWCATTVRFLSFKYLVRVQFDIPTPVRSREAILFVVQGGGYPLSLVFPALCFSHFFKFSFHRVGWLVRTCLYCTNRVVQPRF